MNVMSIIPTPVVHAATKVGLKLAKVSPTILVGAGAIGIVGSVVMACKATLNLDDIFIETRHEINRIKNAEENYEGVKDKDGNDVYGPDKANQDRMTTYVQTGIKIAKLYAPSALVMIASLAMILGSHKMMLNRNAALLGLYKLCEKSFNEYRGRVIEEFGKEKDYALKHGLKIEETEEIEADEEGNEVAKTIKTVRYEGPSQYAFFFDETNVNWNKNSADYNFDFLMQVQNECNRRLQRNGSFFLNELRDMIGVPRTEEGCIVGWVNDGTTIDLGIFVDDEAHRDFVNGYEKSILIDPNVQGVVYDLI